MYKTRLAAVCCAIVLFMLNGCNETKLQSHWKTRKITVDGSDADWQNATVPLEGSNVAVGAVNDDRNLYLCLIISDQRTIRQIAGLGFTVWFDPSGGEEKKLGIHFPLGFQGQHLAGAAPEGAPEETGNSYRNDPDRREAMLQNFGKQLEILGPGKEDRFNALAPGSRGVLVQVSHTHDNLVYELTLPLTADADHPFAVGAAGPKTIGVGFEVNEPSAKLLRNRSQNDGDGDQGSLSGMRGGRGSRGGGGRRGSGGPRGEGVGSSKILNVWTQVTLADSSGVK